MTPSQKIPSQGLKSVDITKAKEELTIAKAKFGQTRPTKREVDELAGRLPETPAFLKEMFLLYGKAMAFDRMEQFAEKLLALDPSDADIRFRLIDTAIEQKNSSIFSRNAWSVARSHLDAAQKDPKLTVTAWLTVADCYLRIDEPELALRPAQNAVELADVTQIAASRLKLVEVMIHLSQIENARSELDRLRDKSLTPLETLRFSESFEKLYSPRQVTDCCRRTIAALSNVSCSPSISIRLARMLMRQGLTTEAKQVVLDKKVVYSNESWVALEFHRLCFDLELNELAREYAMSFLEKNPHDNFMTTRLVLLNMLLRSPQASKTPKESDKGIIARMVGRLTKR